VADGAGSFAFETDATARASLGVLPSFNVCSTCAYTTIQSAITAADSAGGGVVKVAPGVLHRSADRGGGRSPAV